MWVNIIGISDEYQLKKPQHALKVASVPSIVTASDIVEHREPHEVEFGINSEELKKR